MIKKLLGIVLVVVVVYGVSITLFTQTQATLLALVALLVALWTTEVLPLGVVSLLPIIMFPAFGILDTKMTTANYAHPIIYLFLGGFLIAIAVEKTQLHMLIAHKVLTLFCATPRGMIFSLATTSALLSSILSNTTTTLLLMPVALFLTTDAQLKMRFALAIAYGASIGGILTPVGTPPNLILMGIMDEYNLPSIAFFNWMVMVAPIVIVMLIGMGYTLSYGIKKQHIQTPHIDTVLTKAQKKVLWVLGFLIVLLFLNAPIKPYWNGLGLSESGILLGFGLLLFVPGFAILEWKEDAHKIPYAIIFLFGAGFSIAKAFSYTHLAEAVAHYLILLSTLDQLWLIVIVALLITFTTEITSNTALISIMLPVIYALGEQTAIDTPLLMMVATVCASYAFMLPIATAPNAIAMSSGVVQVKDMIRFGFLLNLLGIGVIVLASLFFWPFFM